MEKYILLWYSRIILNIQTKEVKIVFRKLEAATKRLTKLKLHLEFNELCIQENLLPIYTNIYIYIYIYIYIVTFISTYIYICRPFEANLYSRIFFYICWPFNNPPSADSPHIILPGTCSDLMINKLY